MREHNLKADDVREFRIHVGDFQRSLCEPIDQRIRPITPGDARFSIPFCIGVAAAHGNASLGSFLPAGLQNSESLKAAAKVTPVIDDAFNWTSKLPQARLEIETRDGRTFSATSDKVLGHEDLPLDFDFLKAKFADCARFASTPLSERQILEACDICAKLEEQPDATSLIRAMR
jgi:2-methylcitrate dehydratase PrpD